MHQRLSVKRYAPNIFKCVLWKQNTQRLHFSSGKRKTALASDPVSLPSETSMEREVAPVEKRKPRTSFSRAKSAIFEYSACNPWQYMITVTVSPEKFDRENLDDIMRHFAQWVRNHRRNPGWDGLKYILVPEKHDLGGWHLHGFILGVPDHHQFPRFAYEEIDPTIDEHHRRLYWKYYYLDQDGYVNFPEVMDRFGWVTLKALDDNRMRVAGYITKYITKDFFSTPEAFGASLYYSCRGLERPSNIFYGDVLQALVPDIDLRDMFMSRLFNYANDYIRAGFCTGVTIQSNSHGVLGVYAWIDENEFPVKLFDLVSAQKLNSDFVTQFPAWEQPYFT